MVFSSIVFLFRFLPLFLICYFAVPQRMKNFILLLGSLVFYAWGEPVYIVLMLFSTFSDYVHGRLIEKFHGLPVAKVLLGTSLLINLSMLGFYKYADFLIQTVNGLTGTSIPLLELPLPIGISFYTFQTMAYIIDVYRGEVKAQQNLLDFAVFVTMFPKLIAGPIVRYSQVEGALHNRPADPRQISYGAKRFVTGLAKKIILADNLGILWAEISAMNYGELSVLTAWMGIVAFAFQIYFDFSGYSDMAIGLGAVLGFRLPENFNYPYISVSVTEFWRRWHITLSTWFREYVYIPLGGNRKGLAVQLVNILVVWVLTGIWHRADWTFLLWGLWFALFLILEKLFLKKVLNRLPKVLGWLYTVTVVLVSWVLFSLDSLPVIEGYLGAMFGLGGGALWDMHGMFLGREYLILLAVAIVACLPLGKLIAEGMARSRNGLTMAIYRLGEKVIFPVLLLLSIAYLVQNDYTPFMYFRF